MKSRSPKHYSSAQRTVAVLGAALLVTGAAACSLDRSGKLACDTSADCLSGFSCVAQICRSGGAAGAGAGSAGAPPFDTGINAESGASGAPHVSDGNGHAGAAGSSGVGSVAASAMLESLSVSAGALVPAFDRAVHSYTLDLPLMVSTLRFTATSDAGTHILLDGSELASGTESGWADLDASGGTFRFTATQQSERNEYTVQARRGQSVPSTGLIKPSEAAMYDPFGTSVALDGDTLVVGATASVDVYRLQAGQWAHEAHLQPKNGASDDDFGTSVALSGDTLVAGASLEDSSASGVDGDRSDDSLLTAGAAYVFTRDGKVWTERAYLKASDPQRGASFGSSVAIAGDSIAIGAPGESSSATGIDGTADSEAGTAGAVYLFSRSGDSWLQSAYVKASNTAPLAMFGTSLALTAHGLAVGAVNEASPAPGSEQPAMGSGAVYLFSEKGGIWSQNALLKASNAEVNDAFGQSVAFDDDTLVIGAPREDGLARGASSDPTDNSAEDSGAVYVFAREAAGWSQRAYLKPDRLLAGDVFGWSVALSEHTIAVGAWAESRHDGVAYVFAAQGSAWSQRVALDSGVVRGVGFKSQSPDGFGSSLALGPSTLVVGAPYEGVPVWNTPHGSCYSFE